jgi:hypothetical protein
VHCSRKSLMSPCLPCAVAPASIERRANPTLRIRPFCTCKATLRSSKSIQQHQASLTQGSSLSVFTGVFPQWDTPGHLPETGNEVVLLDSHLPELLPRYYCRFVRNGTLTSNCNTAQAVLSLALRSSGAICIMCRIARYLSPELLVVAVLLQSQTGSRNTGSSTRHSRLA